MVTHLNIHSVESIGVCRQAGPRLALALGREPWVSICCPHRASVLPISTFASWGRGHSCHQPPIFSLQNVSSPPQRMPSILAEFPSLC